MNLPRSVNIADDRAHKGIIESYYPTQKTLQVVRAVFGVERSTASNVVAPYGAGKSLAALVGITLLEDKGDVACALRERIAAVDPELAIASREVIFGAQILILHGACPDLTETLAECAKVKTSGNLRNVLGGIRLKARKTGVQRIVIVWDEFGQHLETLVREGRPESLLEVQNLAEWTVRQSQPRVTLTTLMHQGIHSYIQRVSDVAQSSWNKIVGRFETINVVDDGLEVFEMLGDALNAQTNKHSDVHTPPEFSAAEPSNACKDRIARARTAGFFTEIFDEDRLTEVFKKTASLTPAALQILPHLASRVSQAKRTMFHFIQDVVVETKSETPVGVDALYDFFASAMQADSSPGGTHRRYVEAESALSRVESDLDRQLIKTVALLQLGRSSERLRVPRAKLVYALAESKELSESDIEKRIDSLIERKVILYRRRIDDVLLWHGSDLDLGQMIAEEARRLSVDQDLVSKLEDLFTPDAYTAPRYNYSRGVTRFARAQYVKANDLYSEQACKAIVEQADGEDALVLLVIDATADQPQFKEVAKKLPAHIIIALSLRPIEITPILAELVGICAILEQQEILKEDPLIERELCELKGQTETLMRQSLEQLMNPDRGEVMWLSKTSEYWFTDGFSSGDVLSKIFSERFFQTPRILNEQVVRRKVSAVTRSARKRCMLAVLERAGLPEMGYQGATSADASLYRTVLKRTGLYREYNGNWVWCSVMDLENNKDIKRVWSCIRTFFIRKEHRPKSFDVLIAQLTEPPIGLREGVVPLFVAAGLSAFGRCLALREFIDGYSRYVDDIQPSTIERICLKPNAFQIEVPFIYSREKKVIERMICCLVGRLDLKEPDLIRNFYDAMIEWRSSVSSVALTTKGLGKDAKTLQPLIRKKYFDPLQFVNQDLPHAFGQDSLNSFILKKFTRGIAEIQSASSMFADRAIKVAATIFNNRIQGEDKSLLTSAEVWADCMPLKDDQERILDHEARGVLSKARRVRHTAISESKFITQLNGILCGEGFEAWDERTVEGFRSSLEKAVMRVENAVLNVADSSEKYEPFIKNQVASMFELYRAKIGQERLVRYLDEIYREST